MTLREAIKALVEEYNLDDRIYDVRERILGFDDWCEANPETSTWEHPKVIRFGEVCMVLKRAVDNKWAGLDTEFES